MTDYIALLTRLLNIGKYSRLERGLTCAWQLAGALGHPQRYFKTIHIAGTNGKGSVSTKIAKALELSGYKTGLYTSPHLACFRERVVVQGEKISEEEAAAGLQTLFAIAEREKLTPTFFELATFLALEHFRKQEVDIAVIETGLGGRLDATNVIEPLLCVITSIAEDHQEILGETLDQIAVEKAGIIKARVPVVVGSKADFPSMRAKAALSRSPLILCREIQGFYDLENQEIARTALQALTSFHLPQEAIEEALLWRPPCRFESIDGVILDVAHNPNGFERLIEAIDVHEPKMPVRALVGISREKEIFRCLTILSKRASHIHLVEAPTARAASKEEMGDLLAQIGYTAFSCDEDLLTSFEKARRLAKQNGERLVVCGSFYLMPPIRLRLGKREKV